MTRPPRRPQVYRLDEIELQPALESESGSSAEPMDPDAEDTGAIEAKAPTGWRSLTAILLAALGGLAILSIGLSLDRLLADLFVRAEWLGWAGVALAATALAATFVIAVRETVALRRLRRIKRIRDAAAVAAETDDAAKARGALAELIALYRRRPSTARARAALLAHSREIIDGRDLIGLGETELLIAFDGQARRMVLAAAKRVSSVTAVSPRAMFNVGFVLFEVTRLVRRLALLYGGGRGFVGFITLAKGVAGHLAVTGGMAAGHTLLQQLIGHGIAARLSARLAEGLINGMLTARVGIAAIEVCRPFPFIVGRAPRLGEVVAELARGGERTGKSARGKTPPEDALPDILAD